MFSVLSILLLNSCTKEDACLSSNCKNGGYCNDGSCVCPDGYSGSDCGQQRTPTQIRVSKIEITRFPATESNGAGWDLTSGADLIVEIKKGTSMIWAASTFFQNANPDIVYTYNLNPIPALTSPLEQYNITLYDYDDFDANDFMGGINFTPYSSNNGFPSIINLDAGGSVAFRLHVDYAW